MINNSWTSKTAIWMRSFIPTLIIAAIILIALYFISLQNYLLFHGIVELAGIAVALCIFIIVWNTRKLITNTFFLIVGISFLFTGSFDLVHTLAYKGMGVFAGAGSDLPTQLWIAARYFQSVTFLIATLFIGKSITKNRKYDTEIIIITFTLACSLLYASILVWQNFPHCFIDGSGLTPFKIISEYIISAIFVASIIVIYVKRKAFDYEVWQLLLAALIFMILGELAFTSYISVYGFMNMLGHLFRLISVYLFYRAFVVVSLTRPYNLLFRELKENENALRESEERYRAIYDQSPIAIELYDATGALVHVNPACLNLFGVKNMQVLGGFSLFADPNISNEQKTKLHQREMVQYQGPFDFEKVKALDLYPTSREGIIWLDVLITPLGNREVPVTGFLVQIQDITERNKVGVNLRETNEYLNNLFDYANAPIITWDPGFHITRFNHAFERLTGRSQDEVLEKTLDFLFPDETRNASMALIQKAVSGERMETVEIPILTKDGNIRTVIWNSANVLDPEGRTISTIAQGTDITERKQALDALFQTNNKLNMLNNITRHDILNQLMGLQTYLELSKMDVIDPVFLNYIQKEEQAAETIQWMIEFTRDYQDIGGQGPKWHILSDTISTAISQLKPPNVEINVAANRLEIFADPLMEKVFYNLMENSLRHGEHVTRMDFSLKETENGLILTYSDNGVGVSVEDKKKLFVKGFGKHTGLGLFLSKEILSITGITITENGEPGKGVQFEMTVPKGAWRTVGKKE
jgi:PAS domain S-box-containing protein